MLKESHMEILIRETVKQLPRKKKNIYQYIIDIEESLAKQAKTKKEFLSLLSTQLPHQQAASHFNMSLVEVVQIMQEIEDDLSKMLDSKGKKYKWIDYTDIIFPTHLETEKEKTMQYFLCLH